MRNKKLVLKIESAAQFKATLAYLRASDISIEDNGIIPSFFCGVMPLHLCYCLKSKEVKIVVPKLDMSEILSFNELEKFANSIKKQTLTFDDLEIGDFFQSTDSPDYFLYKLYPDKYLSIQKGSNKITQWSSVNLRSMSLVKINIKEINFKI